MAGAGNNDSIRVKIEHIVTQNSAPTPEMEAMGGALQSPQETQQKLRETQGAGKNTAKVLALQYAKRGAMDIVSNWGDMTGDYQTQGYLSAFAELSMTTAMVIANPILGGISAAVTYGGKAISLVKERKESARNARFQQRRVNFKLSE